MSRALRFVIAFSLALACTGFAVAQSPSEPQSPQIQAGPVAEDSPAVVQPKLSPMHQELADMRERVSLEIEALGKQFASTNDAETRLQLQQRIAKAKHDMQLSSFEIQLRYAQAEGRAEVATKLEQAIEQFKNPVIVQGKPVDRPRPADAPQH